VKNALKAPTQAELQPPVASKGVDYRFFSSFPPSFVHSLPLTDDEGVGVARFDPCGTEGGREGGRKKGISRGSVNAA
jgi:hypothetical protein